MTLTGWGKFTKVDVATTLDATKAGEGEKVFSVKCSSCHKLTDEKISRPGMERVLPHAMKHHGS